MLEAIERIRMLLDRVALETFEASWEKRWLVERGLEIISEANRRLAPEIKDRHPQIPWPKVAGIGNILRHDYHRVAADVLWSLARRDLAGLASALQAEHDRPQTPEA